MSTNTTTDPLALGIELGFSAELATDLDRLLTTFNLEAASVSEQTVFLLEFGRLAHDRYQQLIDQAQAKGQSSVIPYAQCVRDLVHEVTSRK